MTDGKTWTTGIDSSQQERFLTVTNAGRVQIVRVNPRESFFETPEFPVKELGSEERRRQIQRWFGADIYDAVLAHAKRRFPD